MTIAVEALRRLRDEDQAQKVTEANFTFVAIDDQGELIAARDVIGHLRGTIDTPEKYEAKRLEMAQRVWDRMKESDSRECRNCHDFGTMDPAKQKDRSVVRHESAIEDGQTCMDCHKGIAHNTRPPQQQAQAPG